MIRRTSKRGLYFMTGIAFLSGFFIGVELRSRFGFLDDDLEANDTPIKNKKAKIISDNSMELLSEIFRERLYVEKKLKNEYAHYFGKAFDRSYMTQQLFPNAFADSPSRDRLTRRIMMKILSARALSAENFDNLKDGNSNAEQAPKTTFTWVTAGDSSTAGYGNLYEQSYTAVLEDTVKDAFAALGIQFLAINSAIGENAISVSELTMCFESVFGKDIDVFLWDFPLYEKEMTVESSLLWGNRAAIHPTRPILFMIDSIKSHHWQQLLSLESNGMGTLLMNRDSFLTLMKRFPDANDESRDPMNLPPSLRYFICNGVPEGTTECDDSSRRYRCTLDNSDVCTQNKWDTNVLCNDVMHQDSWHPGWKEHQLKGRLLGYFLLDLIEESLIMLDSMESASSSRRKDKIFEMQSELEEREERDLFLFQQSMTSSIFDETEDVTFQFDITNLISQKLGSCTSSLLPFQLGNTVQTSFGWNPITGVNDTSPLLVTPIKNFGHCDRVYAHREGVFIVKEGEGWHELDIPSNMDEGTNTFMTQENDHGYIFVCFRLCVDDDCNQHMEGLNTIKIEEGNVEILVDSIDVTSAEEIDGCYLLKSIHGKSWLNNESPRRHKIHFRVNELGARVEITSLILI